MSLLCVRLRSSHKASTLPTELAPQKLAASFDRDVRMAVAILTAFCFEVCMAVSHRAAWEIWACWSKCVAEAFLL